MISIRHVRFGHLSEADRSRHFEEMTSVVARSVTPGVALHESWAARDWVARRSAIIAGASAYEARGDGQLIGFVTYQLERLAGRPTIHLQVACVVPEHQSSGLGYQMSGRILFRGLAVRPWAGVYVGGHVINPIALKGWTSQARDTRNCYPHIGDVPPPRESLVQAAYEFAERHDQGLAFDKATGVVTGKHLPGRRVVPACGDVAVDEHYARYVDPARGDTVLMLLDGNPRVIASQAGDLARSVWRVASAGRRNGRR